MRDFFLNILVNLSFIEWIAVWCLLLLPIFISISCVKHNLKNKQIIAVMVFALIGIIFTGILFWLIWRYGLIVLYLSINQAAIFGKTIVFVIIAFPISWIGYKFRMVYEYAIVGQWIPHGRTSLFIGLTGLALIIIVMVLITSLIRFENIIGLIAIICLALTLGWFGKALAPDI